MSFESVKGQFSLLHNFDGKVGLTDASCFELFAWEPGTRRSPVRPFDVNGIVTLLAGHPGVTTSRRWCAPSARTMTA